MEKENHRSNSFAFFAAWLAVVIVAFASVGTVVWYVLSGGVARTTQTVRSGIVNTVQPSKTVSMQGQWKGEDKREDYIVETLKEFQTRNPNIDVNVKWNSQFPGGRAGAIHAIIDQFTSGKIDWDIIWLEPSYYQAIANGLKDQDWAKHFLVDFETVPGFKESQKPFIITDPQYRNATNGVLAGPYIEGYYQPFFYNKELTDMMGIKVSDAGMTFDDLIEYFREVDEYNQTHGTSIPALYDSGDYKGGIGFAPSVFNIFQSLFRSEFPNISEVEDVQHSPAKMEAVKKVLGSLEQLAAYKPLIPGWRDLDWWDTRYYALENKAVFTAAGASWLYSGWRGIDAQKTMKMVPVEMPTYQSVNHYMGGYNPVFAVAKDSPAVKETVKLLMSFSTPNAAEKWVRYAKGPSGVVGNVSMAGVVSHDANQFDRFMSYVANKYGANFFDSKTIDYILGSQYKAMTTGFCMHLADVMDGKATADEAYAAILADMKAVDEGVYQQP
jgi:hypothetical protein